MNKQPGFTLSEALNGSQSCYITVKRFAFFTVERILARTIDISKNFLNCFWTLFKNVNHLAKRQENGICLIFKKKIAHLAQRRALWTLIIASAKRLKSLFLCIKVYRTLCIRTLHVHNEINSAIVLPTIRLNARHIVNSLSYFTLVWNVISVLVEMANLPIVKIDNFCKNKLIAL